MVRLAGLEPANRVVSSLLIVAFHCIQLHPSIRNIVSVCKLFIASMSNYRKKKLCQAVSGFGLCLNCVRLVFCVRSVSAVRANGKRCEVPAVLPLTADQNAP